MDTPPKDIRQQPTQPWTGFDGCKHRLDAVTGLACTDMPYALPSPNVARHHIVLIMSAELRTHQMQKIEAMADDLENAFHYLSGKGLHARAVQIEPHGLGDLLIQLLNRRGVVTESLATPCKPFACARHPEEIDASRGSQLHDGPHAQAPKPQFLGPQR